MSNESQPNDHIIIEINSVAQELTYGAIYNAVEKTSPGYVKAGLLTMQQTGNAIEIGIANKDDKGKEVAEALGGIVGGIAAVLRGASIAVSGFYSLTGSIIVEDMYDTFTASKEELEAARNTPDWIDEAIQSERNN